MVFGGTDGYGNPLVNTPIRHHKFPPRTEGMYSIRETQVFDKYVRRLRASITWEDLGYPPDNTFSRIYGRWI